MKMTSFALVCIFALGCGGEDNNKNNANNVNNQTNNINNQTNNANNQSNNANNQSNNANNQSNNLNNMNNTLGPGMINIDINFDIGGRTQAMTSCSFAEGNTNRLSTFTGNNGVTWGEVNCQVVDDNSATGGFTFVINFFEDSTGTIDAGDGVRMCGVDGCTGTYWLSLTYQDGLAGVFESLDHTAADAASGSFTLNSFDGATGVFDAEIDTTLTGGGQDFSVTGTFSGTLYPCPQGMTCVGNEGL